MPYSKAPFPFVHYPIIILIFLLAILTSSVQTYRSYQHKQKIVNEQTTQILTTLKPVIQEMKGPLLSDKISSLLQNSLHFSPLEEVHFTHPQFSLHLGKSESASKIIKSISFTLESSKEKVTLTLIGGLERVSPPIWLKGIHYLTYNLLLIISGYLLVIGLLFVWPPIISSPLKDDVANRMIKNMEIGAIVINQKLLIEPPYSRYSELLLATPALGGLPFPYLLRKISLFPPEEQLQLCRFLKLCFGKPLIFYIDRKKYLPTTLLKKGGKKKLSLKWTPLLDSRQKIAKILITLDEIA